MMIYRHIRKWRKRGGDWRKVSVESTMQLCAGPRTHHRPRHTYGRHAAGDSTTDRVEISTEQSALSIFGSSSHRRNRTRRGAGTHRRRPPCSDISGILCRLRKSRTLCTELPHLAHCHSYPVHCPPRKTTPYSAYTSHAEAWAAVPGHHHPLSSCPSFWWGGVGDGASRSFCWRWPHAWRVVCCVRAPSWGSCTRAGHRRPLCFWQILRTARPCMLSPRPLPLGPHHSPASPCPTCCWCGQRPTVTPTLRPPQRSSSLHCLSVVL
jgi:hypothetical protein